MTRQHLAQREGLPCTSELLLGAMVVRTFSDAHVWRRHIYTKAERTGESDRIAAIAPVIFSPSAVDHDSMFTTRGVQDRVEFKVQRCPTLRRVESLLRWAHREHVGLDNHNYPSHDLSICIVTSVCAPVRC